MVERQNPSLSSEQEATANEQSSVEAPGAAALRRTASRRKLLRVGMIGAPVAASLLSRPASATGGGYYGGGGGGGGGHTGNDHPRCTTSGYGHMISAANVVGYSPDSMGGPETCYSKSPDQWKYDCKDSDYFGGTGWSKKYTTFKSVFPSSPNNVTRWDYSRSRWKTIDCGSRYSMWNMLKYGEPYERKMIALCLSIAEAPTSFWVGIDQCDPLYNSCQNGQPCYFLGEQWSQQKSREFCDQFFT